MSILSELHWKTVVGTGAGVNVDVTCAGVSVKTKSVTAFGVVKVVSEKDSVIVRVGSKV